MYKPISLTRINLFHSGASGGDGQTYREAAWVDVYSRCPPAVVRTSVVRREVMCYSCTLYTPLLPHLHLCIPGIFKSVSYTYVRVNGHDMTCLFLLGALRVSSVVFYGFLCPFSCV